MDQWQPQQPQQQTGPPPPMQGPGVRPLVDPEALGEVDPERYPQAKEATHKIRGRSDVLELVFGAVDQELLVVKTFYFFFYSAFGSLFPLMGVYFKQMGMNASQCGLLIGSRPFVEFLSAPFWGSLADRWQKGRTLLLASLAAWILFTLPLGFVQPPATSCMERRNDTSLLRTPDLSGGSAMIRQDDRRRKRDAQEVTSAVPPFLHVGDGDDDDNHRSLFMLDGATTEKQTGDGRKRVARAAGHSPVSVQGAANYRPEEHAGLVRPIISSIVYRAEDIHKAFFLLLLLVVIGEFFSAPAITLADSAVITLLGEDADRYGHQRMFGSLGWGLAMFFVGIALDHSTAFPEHPCGPAAKEKNYTICFATFSVLMGAALISATQISFRYDTGGGGGGGAGADGGKGPAFTLGGAEAGREPTREETMQAQLAEQLRLPQLAEPAGGVGGAVPAPPEEKTKMFAQTQREMPEWVTVLAQFRNLKCASFLFVAWFMGFGIGLIFTFLFWHLQDYGGSPTLFGVASVINHVSEIFAYFFSFRLIRQIGHVKVLCLGLAGNVVRFLYISWLHKPWWVLPFEFMQGITHAAVWAACCSYIAHNTPQQLRSSAQGVLQGVHHGLGRGCGAVVGGLFVNSFGSTATFRGYGFACAIVLAVFIFVNFYRREQGFVSDIPQTEDPRQVAEETAHLAPHGVPSNPIPRALSSTRLHELAGAGQDAGYYGATYHAAADGSLGIPGSAPVYQQQPQLSQQQQQPPPPATNPFAAGGGPNVPTSSGRRGDW